MKDQSEIELLGNQVIQENDKVCGLQRYEWVVEKYGGLP
jgi:hypothetical protein